MTQRTNMYAGLLLAALLTMTGCGGGSSASGSGAGTSGSGSGGTSGTQIQGIATPSSVAVVTATNQ